MVRVVSERFDGSSFERMEELDQLDGVGCDRVGLMAVGRTVCYETG